MHSEDFALAGFFLAHIETFTESNRLTNLEMELLGKRNTNDICNGCDVYQSTVIPILRVIILTYKLVF